MASKNIRGITIEIGGDTTKLGKALEGSEKQTRSLQSELREIEKLLKFDPTNTELLAQKQKVLADMVEQTSLKLNTMKEAEAQVVEQFKKGEIGEEQLRSFQREIAKTEQSLGEMEKELKNANRNLNEFGDNYGVAKEETAKFEKAIKEQNDALEEEKKALKDAEQAQKDHEKAVSDAKKTVDEFSDKVKDGAQKVGAGILAIGTATVAGAGYAVNLSTEFDKAFNTLQTKTGATKDEMVNLDLAMQEVYKNNFGESIEDVAESMATVMTNTKASQDEIQGLTEKAILLRDTFDFDVNESTRSAKMLMDQFGISGEQAYNLIAQGAQAGLDKNGDLLDTLNEYAVHYEQLGYSSEEFLNSLINGTKSGTFSVDKLGDAMKEFGIRSKDTANATTEGFELIGLNADSMRAKFAEGGETARKATDQTLKALFALDDQVIQNQAGVDLFGTMWEDLGIEGVKALMDVTGEASLTSDALNNINNQKYDDIGSALAGLKRSLETDIILPLGEEIKPLVEEAIEYVKENGPEIKDIIATVVTKVGEFVGFMVNHGSLILSTIAGIGAGFVTWQVASTIMTVVEAIKAFQLANEGATIAQALFNAVLEANPIVLIVTLIAMLIAGIVTFIATNEDAREAFKRVWEGIKNIAYSVLEAIAGFFADAWEEIEDIWSVAVSFFSKLWDSIKKVFADAKSFFSKVWTSIKEAFAPAVEWFSKLLKSISDTVSSSIRVIVELCRGLWKTITLVFGVAKSWFSTNVLNPIRDGFSSAWKSVSDTAKNCWSNVQSFFAPATSWFKSNILNPVSKVFDNLWDKLKSGAKTAWSSVTDVFSVATDWFGNIFSSVASRIKKAFSEGGSIFNNIKAGIDKTFKSLVNKLIDGVNTVVQKPFNAINSALSTIRNVSIMGVHPFSGLPSISVPRIPKLAQGGILKRGQIGLLEGDGAEAVVPLEKNTEWAQNIARQMSEYQDKQKASSESALVGKLEDIYNKLDKFNQSIVLDTGVLVGSTIDQIDSQLGVNYNLRARGI